MYDHNQVFTSSGNFNVPEGVTEVFVEMWGAGGRGGGGGSISTQGRRGGGGGAYSAATVSVTPNATYDVVVGVGGSTGTNPAASGGDSYFDDGSEVWAKGGGGGSVNNAGIGGQASEGIGDVKFSGGNGGSGVGSGGGSGGGGGAGDSENGGNGGNGSLSSGGTAGAGGDNEGGNGGVGNGGAGNVRGGGGGGSINSNSAGGNGARGEVRVYWNDPVEELPTVATHEATDITKNSATLHGEVTDDGDLTITRRGFVLDDDTISDPGNVDPDTLGLTVIDETGSFGEETFDLPATSLTPNTQYYFRAFAENSEGFSYGAQEDFTTEEEQFPIGPFPTHFNPVV